MKKITGIFLEQPNLLSKSEPQMPKNFPTRLEFKALTLPSIVDARLLYFMDDPLSEKEKENIKTKQKLVRLGDIERQLMPFSFLMCKLSQTNLTKQTVGVTFLVYIT